MTEATRVSLGPGELLTAPLGTAEDDYAAIVQAFYPERGWSPWQRYGHAVAVSVDGDRAEVTVDWTREGYEVLEVSQHDPTSPLAGEAGRQTRVMLAWFSDDRTVQGYVFQQVVVVPQLVLASD